MAEYSEPQLVAGSDIQRMQYQPEVLFPNRFTSHQPWKNDSDFSSDPLPATIPIYRLSHITHRPASQSICSGRDECTFIPHQKFGKSLEPPPGERRGSTYKYKGNDNFEKISSSEEVLPGYLSWWGIDVRMWYDEGCELLESILDKKENGSYVPGYLAQDTESSYGDQAFSIKLSQILKDYKKARHGYPPNLKVGGTLRYRNEICYVVIVCTERDQLGMPSITLGFPQFEPNGLVDMKGVVVDYEEIPSFKASSIIKKEIAGEDPTGRNKYLYNHFSWEQMVFAFYFPEPSQNLICTKTYKSEVIHFEEYCPKCSYSYFL